MSEKKKNDSGFLVQGSILAVASIVSRIIGLLYRVPLQAIIGNVGNDYYSCAYEIYSMMLLISSYSLPLAVSKMVSTRMAVGEARNARKVLRCGLMFAIVSGVAACLIVFFGAEFLTARVFKTPMSFFALRVLAPTLIIVAVLGVIRGFFQGMGTMVPSAVSQVLEQIVHALVAVGAAYVLYKYGMRVGAVLGDSETYAAAFGAAGGTLGTSVGAVAALAFLLFVFSAFRPRMKRKVRREVKQGGTKEESYGSILKIMILTIIPVLLSTTLYNISSIIDQGIFKNIANAQGYDSYTISNWWGIFSGKYKVLINVPISIASAIASACVPSLAAAYANKDKEAVKTKISSAMQFVMVIAFPCTVGYIVLAFPILRLLFADAEQLAAQLLQIGAVSMIFYSISTLSNGILQGINKMVIPVRNAIVALLAQIAFLFVMMYAFDLNIYAVVLSQIFFSFLMCILNGVSVQRYSKYKLNIMKTFVKPGIASAIMGVAVRLFYELGMKIVSINALWTLLAILVGVIAYFVALLLIRGMNEEDILSFPKGAVLVRIAKKMHLL